MEASQGTPEHAAHTYNALDEKAKELGISKDIAGYLTAGLDLWWGDSKSEEDKERDGSMAIAGMLIGLDAARIAAEEEEKADGGAA